MILFNNNTYRDQKLLEIFHATKKQYLEANAYQFKNLAN